MNKIYYHLTNKSTNKKTGPIVVTTASQHTCEQSNCSLLKNGTCYAGPSGKGGPMAWFWWKVTKGTAKNITSLTDHLNKLRDIPKNTNVRLFQAGQLSHTKKNKLNRNEIKRFIAATKHLRTICYVHSEDDEGIKWANNKGLTLIKSAENISQLNKKLPNSLIIDQMYAKKDDESTDDFKVRIEKSYRKFTNTLKNKGYKPFICPATTHDNIDCNKCMACARLMSGSVVMFPAHGNKKNKIEGLQK